MGGHNVERQAPGSAGIPPGQSGTENGNSPAGASAPRNAPVQGFNARNFIWGNSLPVIRKFEQGPL